MARQSVPEQIGAPATGAVDEARLIAQDLPVLRPAPDLVELDGWLQTEADALEDFHGKVVVLQFWTFSCRNCKATIPTLQQIYSAYGRDQVEIVGVHAPEFGFEEDPDAILAAATELGVSWPIALDTDKRNFHAWQEGPTAYWPRTYVIDAEGLIRFDHIGEGRYEELRGAVAALVAEP
jgi:thiol-disulfide isomerase/thioredoxin